VENLGLAKVTATTTTSLTRKYRPAWAKLQVADSPPALLPRDAVLIKGYGVFGAPIYLPHGGRRNHPGLLTWIFRKVVYLDMPLHTLASLSSVDSVCPRRTLFCLNEDLPIST
jgi:hypothetical protein